MSGGGYPLTRQSLARLRELVREAGEIAASVRESGPTAVRFEAANVLCGVGDLAELVRDLGVALDDADAGEVTRHA